MTYDWQANSMLRDRKAVTSLPPETIDETGWDILLALHSDRDCNLSLQKLASVVSAPQAVMSHWLDALEQHRLITGAQHLTTGKLIAVLTQKGRDLLDRYFSTTGDLQVGAHH